MRGPATSNSRTEPKQRAGPPALIALQMAASARAAASSAGMTRSMAASSSPRSSERTPARTGHLVMEALGWRKSKVPSQQLFFKEKQHSSVHGGTIREGLGAGGWGHLQPGGRKLPGTVALIFRF